MTAFYFWFLVYAVGGAWILQFAKPDLKWSESRLYWVGVILGMIIWPVLFLYGFSLGAYEGIKKLRKG